MVHTHLTRYTVHRVVNQGDALTVTLHLSFYEVNKLRDVEQRNSLPPMFQKLRHNLPKSYGHSFHRRLR